MHRLDSTTKILQLIATATCDVTVTGSDKTSTAYTGFSQETAATASTQTIGAAPAASTVRDIDHITIKSTGGANTLTVQMYNSAGAVTTQATYAVLAANETLEYTHADGWHTLDATGARKVGTAGWVIAAGKIGTLSNSLTFAGTDGSTLNIGTGGTLGTAAYTATSAYEAAGAIATHAALQTGVHGLAITTAKTLTVQASMTLTAADDTGVYTFPTGTKTLLAADGTGASLTAVNAVTLLTKTWAAPAAIGSGTPAAGAFTTLSASGASSFAAGVATLPGIYLAGDTTTGFYRSAANQIAFAASAVQVMIMHSAGINVTGTILALASTGAVIQTYSSTGALNAGDVIGKHGFWKQDASSGGAGLVSYIQSRTTDGGGNFELDFVTGTITTPVTPLVLSATGAAVAGTLSSTGVLSVTDVTDATSATAASLKTAGGIASVKGLWIGTTSRLVGTVTMDSAETLWGNGIGRYSSDGTNIYIDNKSAAGAMFFRTNSTVTQLLIAHTATADRYIRITGSSGGNPTITTSAGSLAITPAVLMASTLGVTGVISGTVNLNLTEMSAPTGIANTAVIYAEDNGAGKTKLMCKLGDDVAIQIAIQA